MDSSAPIKLTYLITGLQYGGANIGMVRLLSELNSDEFDITVVSVVETSDDVVEILPEHVHVYQIDISTAAGAYRISKLLPILRGTDVLVCSLFHASVIGVPLGRALGVSNILVWQHNTTYKTATRRMLYAQLYRLSDHVLSDSEAVSSMLTDEFGVSHTKLSQLPIAGIDTDTFAPTTSRLANDRQIRIGTIGRLAEQKGLFDLLECARQLGSKYQFDIIGQGEKRGALEREAPDNVHFRGTLSAEKLPKQLASYDIYFQPSKYEGLCMTVIEAMACGLPVVASRVGGITESVVPGETGYLCDAGDIDCFCNHLEALATDHELRRSMGAAGRERVVSRYSKSVLAAKFQEALHQTKTV